MNFNFFILLYIFIKILSPFKLATKNILSVFSYYPRLHLFLQSIYSSQVFFHFIFILSFFLWVIGAWVKYFHWKKKRELQEVMMAELKCLFRDIFTQGDVRTHREGKKIKTKIEGKLLKHLLTLCIDILYVISLWLMGQRIKIYKRKVFIRLYEYFEGW